MPAVKCLPEDAMTMQRALALRSISRMMAGSSTQASGVKVLKASGRLIRISATRSVIETSKQEY